MQKHYSNHEKYNGGYDTAATYENEADFRQFTKIQKQNNLPAYIVQHQIKSNKKQLQQNIYDSGLPSAPPSKHLQQNNNNNKDNINKYSYNIHNEEPLNVRTKSNKTNSQDLFIDRVCLFNNNFGSVQSHKQNHGFDIEPNITRMEHDFSNADPFYSNSRSKIRGNENGVRKSNVIVVRSKQPQDDVEDVEEEEIDTYTLIQRQRELEVAQQMQKRQAPLTSKSKHDTDRKSKSFKDLQQDNAVEDEFKTRAISNKRSISVTHVQKENEMKRLSKNQTVLGHNVQNGNQDSSDEEDDDNDDHEEEEDDFIYQKKSNRKSKIVDIEEDEEEENNNENIKIFPSEPTPISNGHIREDNRPTLKSQAFLKEMYNLLKVSTNTMDFAMKKPPQGATIQTHIRRTKRKLGTQYTMFLEMPDGSEVALMQTKRKKASTRLYIWINALELVEKVNDDFNEIERYRQIPCGKLKSKGKLKVIYDKFILTNTAKKNEFKIKKPSFFSKKSKKIEIDSEMDNKSKNIENTEPYKEYLKIEYDNSIFKLTQPLKFTVSLFNNYQKLNILSNKNGFLDYDTKLMTKGPKFDKEKHKYVLDFNKRVTLASVNNFQIISTNPDFENNILLQVGKCKPDEYICDYTHPLSAFEAFAIVLSALNRKLV